MHNAIIDFEPTGTTSEKTKSSGLKLPPPKKKSQPVKISLPALPDVSTTNEQKFWMQIKYINVNGAAPLLEEEKSKAVRQWHRRLVPTASIC